MAGKWKPGQSGNPGGRPRAPLSLAALLKQALREKDPGAKKSRAEQVVDALVAEARAGNIRAIETVLERIDGKVKEQVHHGGSLRVEVVYVDDGPGPIEVSAPGAAGVPAIDETL